MDTHKASTYVTECWPFVCGFVEVMRVIEVVAQFGTYRHSPHEVRGNFFTADLSLPAQEKFPECNTKVSKWVEVFITHSANLVWCFLCFAAVSTWEAFVRALQLPHLSVSWVQKENGKLAAIFSKSSSEM